MGTIGGDGVAGSGGGGTDAGVSSSTSSSSSSGGSGSSGGATGGPPTTFTCDPTQKPALDTLRALTTAQHQNTLTDLATFALGDATTGKAAITEVNAAIATLPGNAPVVPQGPFATVFPDGGWLRADQDQQFIRVEAYYSIGVALAATLTDPTRLGTVVGSCATDADPSNDAACLTAFIQKIGPRALRRALTSADVTALTEAYGTTTTADPAGYADLLTVLFNAPEQLYFVEHGDQPVTGLPGTYTVSATELASRLSYHLWDTMPDDALWSVALDGTLTQDAVYQAQVERHVRRPARRRRRSIGSTPITCRPATPAVRAERAG